MQTKHDVIEGTGLLEKMTSCWGMIAALACHQTKK
jgi:hypothetical protein